MGKEEYEKLEKNADTLEKNASRKCNADIQKAQNFYKGYQQGLEDLLRCARQTNWALEEK